MHSVVKDVLSAAHVACGVDSCVLKAGDNRDVVQLVPGRLLGKRLLYVEAQVDAIAVVQAQTSVLMADVEELKFARKADKALILLLAGNVLRVFAAQVLGMALGFLTLERTESTRARCLPLEDPRIVKLAKMAYKTPSQFQSIADGVITRRNNGGAHWTSMTQLDSEAETCKQLNLDPEVKDKYKWEAWVAEHYDKIKEAFPEAFPDDLEN